ncbi:MAG TPA: uroporphyrinogen decarboxylase family protein [Anaerolineae bacterium]|nr:uroporphyrinogen decarboxylase family protein [Anaerolineae bacterium]HOQ97781.1 uroporphyrinogen decarboxylase family protein [Anaerolineae bacterium]HPL27223.1 uroporphyrinogen decarboxylase family protein [Anaerolineae bacterium]
MKEPAEFLPIEFVFMPSWWHHNYGLDFGPAFYLDRETRITNEQTMNRALWERFPGMGLGHASLGRQPIIGSKHVAGGFVMPALMGCQIRFAPDASPWPEPANLTDDQVRGLQVPDIPNTWPMNELLADMAALERESGAVAGDFDLDGVLNLALHLRGQQFFSDLAESPDLAARLLDVCARAMVQVAQCVRPRTGSVAIATNRMITHVDASLFLHSNCSVQMVSPTTYAEFLLQPELYLARHLQPYGIHHCGEHMERYGAVYAQVPAVFFDVGWGSDLAVCREQLPQAFLSLRLSPARLKRQTPAEAAADAEHLLSTCPHLERAGLCCINVDDGTPDDNLWAVYEVVERYRRYGA